MSREGDPAEHAGPEQAAFYTLSPGGWRDYWSLLHPPYTLWHLSYVTIGAALAPVLHVRWWLETVAAFFLAMGIAAHALDELHGRPLRTKIPSGVLWALAVVGLLGAVGLGIDGAMEVSCWIWAFIAMGVFLVVAYNLELFGGALHSDLWFALAWGAFPVLTGYFAQTGRLRADAVLAAGACAAISGAQRKLSTPVRRLRRHVSQVTGTMTLDGGMQEPLDAAALRDPLEQALRLFSVAVPVLAAAMVVEKLT